MLYSYFMAALMGRQMVPMVNGATGKYEDPDLYFPLFTALQVSHHSTDLCLSVGDISNSCDFPLAVCILRGLA